MSVDYQSLNDQLAALIADEPDALANSANFVALLYAGIPDINWLGIYVLRDQELVLGPFQGQAACVRIPLGQGACGTAAQRNETLRVDNVHEFAGHIVCDPESKSELVVPLSIHGELIGVLDIDSPQPSRFGASDQLGVEILCKTFVQNLQQGPGNFI
jgi:GAF domain-containing protein